MTEDQTAYCVVCKVKQPILKPRVITSLNGRETFLRGVCPKCGGTIFRKVPRD